MHVIKNVLVTPPQLTWRTIDLDKPDAPSRGYPPTQRVRFLDESPDDLRTVFILPMANMSKALATYPSAVDINRGRGGQTTFRVLPGVELVKRDSL